MATIKAKKIDIAVKQLEMAMDLFLNRQDYICTITLAGAAEEILGKLVERAGKKSAHTSIIELLTEKYNLNISVKELGSKYLNLARNTLKHVNVAEEDEVELDAQTESISLIVRAITNLMKLDNSVTYNTPDFFKWLNENRRELLIDDS